MKRFFGFLLALYTVVFSIAVNCYSILTESTALFVLIIALLSVLTVGMGYFCIRTVKIRLRICFHGAVALTVFQLSSAVAITVHAVWLILGIDGTDFWQSVIFCFICEFILFWNGILCIYLASYRLSFKQRLKGALVGLIPIWNLITLNSIIKTVIEEVKSETKREDERRKRACTLPCDTKYPILLVHGVFFRDSKVFNYWGRIPKELKINGARIFYGNHQSADSVANCARELSERIESIVRSTGCEKLNIIAHSKGGLDCRYAIEHYGAGKYIASLTTVNSPHRGCEFAEY
ncbi:MAG: triacylglycerol lipase, partial [Clostridia bacterium]|nr:triacylglycerol lipase [Clostridia bacterium]